MNIPATGWSLRSVMALLALWTFAFAANAQSPITFSKSFTPGTIGPGSVSTLRFDISNNTAAVVTAMAFTDALPTGVTIADPAAASTTCIAAGLATLSAPSGGSTITFSGGSMGGNRSCVVRVNVTSSTPGTHTNTSGNLTSSAGNSGSASADLIVATDRPGFSKVFVPDTVALGGRSTLTFTIDNTANGGSLSQLNFTDNLPGGMVVANPANVSTDCLGVNTLTATPGTGTVSFFANLAVLPSGQSCQVSVDVRATAGGMLGNVSGELLSEPGTRSSGKAGDTLNVTVTPLALRKDFLNDPVPPGSTVTLQFTLRNLDRDLEATNIAFSDNLEAVVPGLQATGLPISGCGGTVSDTGTSTSIISLAGGSLAAGATCTFSVVLDVPGTSGAFGNTTSQVSADLGGSPVTGSPASDVLFVAAVPVLSKEFIDDPVGAGGMVTLRFSITNTSSTSAATDIEFIDELTTILSFPISATLPADGFCGTGSSLALTSLGTDRQGLSLTGGNLGAGDPPCTFDVTLDIPTPYPAGNYVNTTSEIRATVDGNPVIGNAASDTLSVVAAPALTKRFIEEPVAPGDTVTLQFTLRHGQNSPGDATDIAFSDDLNATLAGLEATGLSQSDVCGAGSVLSGTMTLMLTGGVLAPGESCTFSVTLQVPAGATTGTYLNTTSAVQATVLDLTLLELPATDELRISGLLLTKEFTDDPVLPGGTANLRFTITNETVASTATGIAFTDNLSNVISGLTTIGTPTTGTCDGTVVGTNVLSYSGGSLTAGTSCSFDVTLQVPAGAATGTYTNRTSGFVATIDGSSVTLDNARDQLVVGADILELNKEFTDDPVSPGGSVNLRFTVSNLNPTQTITNLAFSDDLNAALPGLTASGLPISACGGTVSGTSTISLTGGSLAGGSSCMFDVSVSVPAAVPGTIAVNLTSSPSGEIGGLAVAGDPATDELRINVLNFSKSFNAVAAPGGTVVLTFSIQNLSSDESFEELFFSDNLDAVLTGLAPSETLPKAACGGILSFAGVTLTLSDASLLPMGSCTFSVQLAVPGAAEPGSYFNITTPLRTSTQGELTEPATANLTVMGANDEDADGVLDDDDLCPGTVIPEGVPTERLGVNRYALVDDDLIFDTRLPPGQDDDSDDESDDASSDDASSDDASSDDASSDDASSDDDSSDDGNGGQRRFTTTDTHGCSCEQIIAALGLGEGHRKFGCSLGVMRDWVNRMTPVFVTGFESG